MTADRSMRPKWSHIAGQSCLRLQPANENPMVGTLQMRSMVLEYINAALDHARYEIIEDAEPYYGEVPELPGVWATGRTLEECRRNLAGVIDEWLILLLRRGLPIPPVAGT